MDAFDDLLRETLVTTALLCLPVLAATTLIGTGIALLQAVTQVQEQTLSLLPKIAAVLFLATVFGSFAQQSLAHLFTSALALLPSIVRG